MRKLTVVAALLLAGTAATLTQVGPAAALAGCNVAWGSQAKQSTPLTQAPLTNVRAGRHACFDRLVVDVAGAVPGFYVEYVAQVTKDGSGDPILLRGGAFLQVVANASAYDANGQPTYEPANPAEVVNVAGFQTFRQVGWGGTFEGHTTLGLGVRARLPFRVTTWQASPTRGTLSIDVAHGW